VASGGDRRIYAEAKGRTAAIGLDVDTITASSCAVCHLKRLALIQFAVVVTDVAGEVQLRVPERVRAVLRIHVHSATEDGEVSFVGDGGDPVTSRLSVTARECP
jgi:hypothetical protein